MPRRIGTERPWAVPPGRVAADLGTDPVAGLSEPEAAGRLAQFGENVLVEQGRKPTWRLLAEQFANTTGGRGAGVVVATGMATELGWLAVLGRWMAAAALVVCAVVVAVGVARGEPREMGHPPAVLKVPPSTGRMARVHRPRSGQAAAWGG